MQVFHRFATQRNICVKFTNLAASLGKLGLNGQDRSFISMELQKTMEFFSNLISTIFLYYMGELQFLQLLRELPNRLANGFWPPTISRKRKSVRKLKTCVDVCRLASAFC